jgi:hypothetical protein
MQAPGRAADPEWDAALADLVALRLDATTTAERDLAGQLLLELLTGHAADVPPACPRGNDVPPTLRG